MIKFLLSLLLLTFLSTVAFSQQVHTIYITGDGVKTTNPDVADSYLMFQQMPNDSTWFVRQFAMNNMIMTSGYYKDEQMTIPHGKFDYYKFVRAYKAYRFDFGKRKYDTVEHPDTNFRVLSGNYVYGKRQGNWERYNERGKLISTSHFQNDIMEGLYREFNPDKGILTFQGIMANNEKVGNWNYFSPGGDILGTEIYKNGRFVKFKSHLNDKQFKIKNGTPDYDVPGYLTQVLSQKKFNYPGRHSAVYYFRLQKDGHLSEPNMLRESKLEIDVAVIDALLNAPVWESAIHEKEPVEAHVTISLVFRVDDDKKIHVDFYSNNSDEQINLYPVL